MSKLEDFTIKIAELSAQIKILRNKHAESTVDEKKKINTQISELEKKINSLKKKNPIDPNNW